MLLVALIAFSRNSVSAHPAWFACALIGLVAAYVYAAIRMGTWANEMFRKLHQHQDVLTLTALAKPYWEYRTRLELLGLPLVHIRFDDRLCSGPR